MVIETSDTLPQTRQWHCTTLLFPLSRKFSRKPYGHFEVMN